MHDFQVWDEWVVHVLPKERGGVEDVEGDAVGSGKEDLQSRPPLCNFGQTGCDSQLYQIQLTFLWHDLINVGSEFGISF